MKTIDVADAVQPLSEYAREAANGPLVVTEDDKPIAAVVPLPLHSEGGADYESLSLRTNLRFLELLGQAKRRVRDGQGIPFEEMSRRLGLDDERRAASRRKHGRPQKGPEPGSGGMP